MTAGSGTNSACGPADRRRRQVAGSRRQDDHDTDHEHRRLTTTSRSTATLRHDRCRGAGRRRAHRWVGRRRRSRRRRRLVRGRSRPDSATVQLGADAVSRGTVESRGCRGPGRHPGFVDSHTHLVFGGDRADEFEARMAGTPYAAGGIRRTVAATRAATDDELRARLAGFVAELHAQGTTTFEIKTGYGLTVARRGAPRAARRRGDAEVTFLGAHVVPAEYADRRDDYVDLVCGDDARRVRAAQPLDRRVLRTRRLRPRRERARPRGGHRPRAPAARARQPARPRRGRAARGRAGRGIRRPLHVPRRRGRRGPRGLRHRRDAAARAWSSRRGSPTPTRDGCSTPV